MLARLAFIVKDFWYPFFFYFLGTSYLLLAMYFFRKRVIIINLLIFLLIVWHMGYAFEIYFRYLYDQTDNFNFLLTSQRWDKRHVGDLNQLIGKEQFRDSKDWREPKPPGQLKIAVVGDSIAYGIGIEKPQDRFSNLLETKLNEAGRPAKVYNLSRPGNDLEEAKANFDKALAQGDFDLIVWQLFPNDLPGPVPAQVLKVKDLLSGDDTNPLLQDLLKRSYAFNFFYFHLWGIVDPFRAQHLNDQFQLYRQDEIWESGKKQMIEIIADTRRRKVKLIAVLFPYVEQISGGYSLEPNEKIASVFAEERIPFISLFDIYKNYQPRELMANRFDSHSSELGHRLAADIIFERVKELY